MNDCKPTNPQLTPMNDWVFQKVFGSEGSEPAAKELANVVLRAIGLPQVERVDSLAADTSLPNAVDLKAPRLDVLLMSGNRAIDFEAQRSPVNIENKALYYASRLLGGRVRKSSDSSYDSIPQTVVIAFLDGWTMFPDPEQFVTACRMHWELKGGIQRGNDRFVFVACELDKVSALYNKAKTAGEIDELTAWLYSLAMTHRNRREVERLMGKIPSIAEFFERYDLAVGDPEAWDAYDREVKWQLEQNSIRSYAWNQGHTEGYEAGHAEGYDSGHAKGQAEGRAKGLAEGRAEGRAKGLAEGLAEGRMAGISNSLTSLMDSTGCDLASAMDMLQIHDDDRVKVEELLSEAR